MADTDTDDMLSDLLAKNAALFAAYGEWSAGQIMLLAGTVDDPNSFDKDGGKTGALGYYPVVNVSGQTLYIPCIARLKEIALGGANAETLAEILGTANTKLELVDQATAAATEHATYAAEQGDYAKAQGDAIGDVSAAVADAALSSQAAASAAARSVIASRSATSVALAGVPPAATIMPLVIARNGQVPIGVDPITGFAKISLSAVDKDRLVQSKQRPAPDFAAYAGSESVKPIILGRNGAIALGLDTATGYIRMNFSPADKNIGRVVRSITNPAPEAAIFSTAPGIIPIVIARNGTVALGLDPATGKIIFGAQSAVSGSPLPHYASIGAFGDSITYGYNSSDDAHKWVNIVAAALGSSLQNSGIPGTVLQNSPDAGGSSRADNGRDRFAQALAGANLKEALLFAYGFNDARYVGNPSAFNVTQYENDLNETLSAAIILGYLPDKIWVISPYYITDVGLQTGSTGFAGQTRAGFEAFVAAAARAADAHGARYCDIYSYMLANGGGNLISDDNIHPNDTGMSVIAAGVLGKSMVRNTRMRPTSVTAISPGAGALAASWAAPADGPAGYEVALMVSATYAWTGAVTVTSASASWSGLASGSYRLRIRATYADGGKSPWAFSPSSYLVS